VGDFGVEMGSVEWRLVYVLAMTDRWLPRLSRVVLSRCWLEENGTKLFLF
jgi:hypothetical protein